MCNAYYDHQKVKSFLYLSLLDELATTLTTQVESQFGAPSASLTQNLSIRGHWNEAAKKEFAINIKVNFELDQ